MGVMTRSEVKEENMSKTENENVSSLRRNLKNSYCW